MADQPTSAIGIVIVDHGSRAAAEQLDARAIDGALCRAFTGRFSIVEPAHHGNRRAVDRHAFGRCVTRGAKRVVICPFFLAQASTGAGYSRLTSEAAAKHPRIAYQ